MAFERKHSAAADGTFSATGAINWNAAHVVSDATSGGIPYFDSATSEASSALLASGGVVLGGGAGGAPNTNAAFSYDGTLLKVGLGQKLNGALRAYSNDASFVTPTVYLDSNSAGSSLSLYGSGGSPGIRFTAATNAENSQDWSISRLAAGLGGIGTGALGSFAGRLKLTSAIAAGVAVGSLNAAPTIGEIQSVTDALAPVAGAAVAAGGAAKALVWYNGAQWTVIGV